MFEKTVHYEESRLIWVRPVCDFFRIDVRNQHRKIKSDPVLGRLVEKSTPDLGRIDDNGRILSPSIMSLMCCETAGGGLTGF